MTEVRYESRGRIGYIVLDRPEKLNALTDQGFLDFRLAMDEFDDDEEAWVAILYGVGRAFSSGADVGQRQNRSPQEIRRLGSLRGHRDADITTAFSTQRHCKPIIAAVHGYAIGGALRMALHSDAIVAAAGTVFQVTEVARGVDAGLFWRLLSDRMGTGFADKVCLSGRRWSPEDPWAVGFATETTEPGKHLEAAEALAAEILRNPPLAVRAIVRTRRARIQQSELDARNALDRSLILSEDFRESVRAFVEKREPATYHAR